MKNNMLNNNLLESEDTLYLHTSVLSPITSVAYYIGKID